jgi:hypothetical protein
MSTDPSIETRLRRLAAQTFESVLRELTDADPLDLEARMDAVVAQEGLWAPHGIALAKVRRAVARALTGAPGAALDAAWLDEQITVAAREATNHAATSTREAAEAWAELASLAAARFGVSGARGFDVLTHFHALDRAQRALLLAGMRALETRNMRELSAEAWRDFDASFRGLVRTLFWSGVDDVAP